MDWVTSAPASSHSERQIPGVRDGFGELKNQTALLEEYDTITRGIKLFCSDSSGQGEIWDP